MRFKNLYLIWFCILITTSCGNNKNDDKKASEKNLDVIGAGNDKSEDTQSEARELTHLEKFAASIIGKWETECITLQTELGDPTSKWHSKNFVEITENSEKIWGNQHYADSECKEVIEGKGNRGPATPFAITGTGEGKVVKNIKSDKEPSTLPDTLDVYHMDETRFDNSVYYGSATIFDGDLYFAMGGEYMKDQVDGSTVERRAVAIYLKGTSTRYIRVSE